MKAEKLIRNTRNAWLRVTKVSFPPLSTTPLYAILIVDSAKDTRKGNPSFLLSQESRGERKTTGQKQVAGLPKVKTTRFFTL